jgi:hypothetical protein
VVRSNGVPPTRSLGPFFAGPFSPGFVDLFIKSPNKPQKVHATKLSYNKIYTPYTTLETASKFDFFDP